MNELELLVPAYGNPANPDGSYMWNSLIETAATSDVKLNVILNPNSGPGSSPIDPNYINSDPNLSSPLLELENAGGVIYGYVATTFGNRAIQDVKDDIDRYNDPQYYRNTGFQIDGIFLDEMSNENDPDKISYYEEIQNYIQSNFPSSAQIIGNPGTSTIEEYIDTVDTLITFENYGVNYRNNYNQPDWEDNYSPERFAHLIHTELLESDMLLDVELAKSRNVGMIYISDDVCDPNIGPLCTEDPWDKFPSYWEIQVNLIEDDGPVPTNSDDTLTYTNADDIIDALAGNDVIRARGGNDDVFGNDGEDTLIGQSGNDTLGGGADNDRLFGGNDNDSLIGGSGKDVLIGGFGNDTLIGVDESDLNPGFAENDVLIGSSGADLYILGNETTPFYLGNGGADRVVIKTFDVGVDEIQLHGSESEYLLKITNSGKTKIFENTGLAKDLIGVVWDTTGLELSDTDTFVFV